MTTVIEPAVEVEQPVDPHRADLIAGLRDLAAFLEANPHIPTPHSPTLHVHPALGGTDAEMFAAARNVAHALNVEAEISDDRITASRWFGPVEYKAAAICAATMQGFRAAMEYEDNLKATAVADAAQVVTAVLALDQPRTWSTGDTIDSDVDEVTDSHPVDPNGTWRRDAEGDWRYHSPDGGRGAAMPEAEMLQRYGDVTEVVAGREDTDEVSG